MAGDLASELESVLDILEHARKNHGRLPGDPASFARRLERLNKMIQKSPRLQLIRPATIALHNLAMTLGSDYEADGLFLEDIENTREALEPLLDDETLGLTPQELRSKAREALKGKVGPCPMCGAKDWDVEIAANVMVEFPGEYRHPPPRVPIANLVCRGCGFLSMHKLSTLGVIPKRRER